MTDPSHPHSVRTNLLFFRRRTRKGRGEEPHGPRAAQPHQATWPPGGGHETANGVQPRLIPLVVLPCVFSPLSNDLQLPALTDREVQVWYALTSGPADPAEAEFCRRLLDPEEVQRHAAFLNPRAQAEYLATRALVRTLLGRILNAAPEALRFRKNQFGRPELFDSNAAHPLQFNVSHSAGLIACAVAWRREIGLDVESTVGAPIEEDVPRRNFSPVEFADYLGQPTPAARHRRFLEYWTLKESYLKARGTGLSLPTNKFTCRWSRPREVDLTLDPIFQDDAATWQLRLLQPPLDFVAALAVRVTDGASVGIAELWATPLSLAQT